MKTIKFLISNLVSLLTSGKLLETSDYFPQRSVICNQIIHKRFTGLFGLYFIGNDSNEPIEFIPLECFGLSHMKVFENDDYYLFQIKLRKPCILIGKGGKTIDGLKEYLTTDKEVVIHLIEETTKLHYDGDYVYEW